MARRQKKTSRQRPLTPEEIKKREHDEEIQRMITDPVMGPLLIKFRCAVLGCIGWPQECCDDLERAMMEDMFPEILAKQTAKVKNKGSTPTSE